MKHETLISFCYSKAGTKPISSLVLVLILLKYILSFSKVPLNLTEDKAEDKGQALTKKLESNRFWLFLVLEVMGFRFCWVILMVFIEIVKFHLFETQLYISSKLLNKKLVIVDYSKAGIWKPTLNFFLTL